jgi:hypothetical protein
MQLVKLLGSTFFRASLLGCGSLLLLTAMGGTAWAVDITPEIDPGSITSAFALLTGSILLLMGRRARK